MASTSRTSESDDRLSPLTSNAAAIRAVAAAVEGTLGPKGMNCMLVDRFGETVITNDGSAILERIDIAHPAARILVEVARAQDREVGDGTTTATLLADALICEGCAQVERGVPVTRVLEGMRLGVASAVSAIQRQAITLQGVDDPLLKQVALIAGRGQSDIAGLVLDAARRIGEERLMQPGFRLADWIIAREGAASEVVEGVVLDKEPMSRQMPHTINDAAILCLDDALEPESIEEGALGTEAGFSAFMRCREEFRSALQQLVDLGVRAVFTTRAVHEAAEEAFTEAGGVIIRRLTIRDLHRVAQHAGSRLLKRAGLRRSADELKRGLGHAAQIAVDERAAQTRIIGGAGEPMATMLVGAATSEVRAERERMAEDAACAVQAALREGVVPGGGATELAVIQEVESCRRAAGTMASYGVDCVLKALGVPLMRIVANAGFNALEKIEAVKANAAERNTQSLAIDCETGDVVDMLEAGVVDPVAVKVHALRAAGEVAEAILRINTIIRKRDDATGSDEKREGGRSDL